MTVEGSAGAEDGQAEHGRSAVTPARPVPLSRGNLGLVALGGAAGTGMRYGLVLLVPAQLGVPVAIFGVNVAGAFLLGVLLEALAERSVDAGWSRRLRLGVGTGVLGGFTTYSTLATDNVALAMAHPPLAVAYGLGTVVVGGVASLLGIALARHWLRPALRPRTGRRG